MPIHTIHMTIYVPIHMEIHMEIQTDSTYICKYLHTHVDICRYRWIYMCKDIHTHTHDTRDMANVDPVGQTCANTHTHTNSHDILTYTHKHNPDKTSHTTNCIPKDKKGRKLATWKFKI
jgi:hypothetical protein